MRVERVAAGCGAVVRHPPHVSRTGVIVEEGRPSTSNPLERPQRFHDVLVQRHQRQRPFDRHPDCLPASATPTGHVENERRLSVQQAFDRVERSFEMAHADELLRQGYVWNMFFVQTEPLRAVFGQSCAQLDGSLPYVRRWQNGYVECKQL